MRIHRFTLLFIPLTLLIMAPALAEEVGPTAAPAPAQTVTVEQIDSADTSASVSETELDVAGSENTVLEMLGVTSPITTESSLSFGAGFCYHDCSACETRADCGGFPCTEIPLC